MACMGGLLDGCRQKKAKFCLLTLCRHKKHRYPWVTCVFGAGGAGCVLWLLLSFAGGRSKRYRDCHVIGVLLGQREVLSVVQFIMILPFPKLFHGKGPNMFILINIIIHFGS